ncbi:MAG: methyltransferase, TIGR04325 family [Myxococcales bacterium]|nr:methyltransferase, TIGR04325 family [Myxococcales bacterium]HRC56644.1 methyltransferase, TIGR04325 family [Kofleriaceae bacterium]
MGIIDVGKRISNNAWRLPLVGQVLEADYARSFARRPPNRFRGVYATFAEAEASVPGGERLGYDHAELAGMYRHRMEKACQSDYAVLFWLRKILDAKPASFVFDLGGHVGVSYHGWRKYLDYKPGLRWLVEDVPAIIKVGAELAAERDSPGLAFTSDLGDSRGCDVFLAAGSLQYVEESLPSILVRSGPLPRHLILNKMPVYDGETFYTVQSTGRAFHAYRIYSRAELVGSVTSLGYSLVDDWENREQHCEIPFTRGRDIDAYSGYYFTRNA